MSRYMALTLLEDDLWLGSFLDDIKGLGGSITVDEYCAGGPLSRAENFEQISRLRSLGLVSREEHGIVALTSLGRSIAYQRATGFPVGEGRPWCIRQRVLEYFDVGAHTSRHVHKYCQWPPGEADPTHDEVAEAFAWLDSEGLIAAESRGDTWIGFARMPAGDDALLRPDWWDLIAEAEMDADPCDVQAHTPDPTGLKDLRDLLHQALVIVDQLPVHEVEQIRARRGATENVCALRMVARRALTVVVDGALSRVRHRR